MNHLRVRTLPTLPTVTLLATLLLTVSISAAPPTMTYREARTVVECGMEIVVYAGVPLPATAPLLLAALLGGAALRLRR
jgi:hypothetical protein